MKKIRTKLIYYSEKIDITEEKVRLKEHCIHFKNSLKKVTLEKNLDLLLKK